MRVTKSYFYNNGGLSNRNLYRRFVSGKWQYYRIKLN